MSSEAASDQPDPHVEDPETRVDRFPTRVDEWLGTLTDEEPVRAVRAAVDRARAVGLDDSA